MATLTKITWLNYEPIYEYRDGDFRIYANTQSGFSGIFKDFDSGNFMGEETALKARNMDVTSEKCGVDMMRMESFVRRLTINGLDLIPKN